VIGAFGAGSTVTLNNISLSGGTLETSGGGQILVNNGTVDGSNGHTVTNTGNVVFYGVNLLGTISNTTVTAADA
jgi:hypothetical protein